VLNTQIKTAIETYSLQINKS